MAFSLSALLPVGGQSANGVGIWTYSTTDLVATIDSSGYFNTAADRLKVGDVIFITLYTSTTPTGFAVYVVQSNTGTVVDVFDAAFKLTSLDDTD